MIDVSKAKNLLCVLGREIELSSKNVAFDGIKLFKILDAVLK